MRRIDRVKLALTRNWNFPGKERLSSWLNPSDKFKNNVFKGIVWLTNEDIAIYTNADNYIEWTILSTGTYEDEINKLIRISLQPGNVALDIGSNIGLQSLRMSQAVGTQGKVYAFEPLNYLREKCNQNIKLNKALNIEVLAFALSDKENEATFKINKNSWNQGTFNINGKTEGTEEQRVIIKVADRLPEIMALERLDLIKIDVEGLEYQVLLGLTHTLTKHKPRIILEYDSNYWQANGQSIFDCVSFLHTYNYTLYQITAVACELINEPADIQSGNIFCVQS